MTDTTREKAVKAVLEHCEDSRGLGAWNHLLEDELSTNRVRQVIAFLAEITLEIGGRRFSDAMTNDALEGLGWILRWCHEALGTLEDIQDKAHAELRAATK